jgi:hypothetical protein
MKYTFGGSERLLIVAVQLGCERCTTTLSKQKGEIMKRNYLRFFAPFFAAAFLGAVAQGQETDRVTVNIPYDFVVSGKTLTAGTYRVERVDDYDQRQLLICSVDGRSSILTSSSEVEDSSQDRPALTFVHSGDQHFLAKIQTAEHVFKFAVPDYSAQSAAAISKHSGSQAGTPATAKP